MPRLFHDLLQPFDEKRQRGPAAPEKTKRRTSRQKRERQARDDEYNGISDIYKDQTRACAYCGRELPTDQMHNDHIVSGVAGRAESLLHFDTWNIACRDCSTNKSISRAVKAACKLIVVLRTIEALQKRNFSTEENRQILKLLRERKAGHSR